MTTGFRCRVTACAAEAASRGIPLGGQKEPFRFFGTAEGETSSRVDLVGTLIVKHRRHEERLGVILDSVQPPKGTGIEIGTEVVLDGRLGLYVPACGNGIPSHLRVRNAQRRGVDGWPGSTSPQAVRSQVRCCPGLGRDHRSHVADPLAGSEQPAGSPGPGECPDVAPYQRTGTAIGDRCSEIARARLGSVLPLPSTHSPIARATAHLS